MLNQPEDEGQPFSEGREAHSEKLYGHRFPASIWNRRIAVWQVLCQDWFSRYIPKTAKVLEVGAGYCEFINNIEAAEKVAIDFNPDAANHATAEVSVYQVAAERLADVLPPASVDVVFMSNFLEHCASKEMMLKVLAACASVLKPGGRLLILGPNFRYCYKQYFDFFDHYIPLTEKSVVEALAIVGFRIEVVQARTLPYTLQGHLPTWPWLVRWYLRMPFIWPLFGAQFFIVGVKE